MVSLALEADRNANEKDPRRAMTTLANIPTANFAQTLDVIRAACIANQTVLMIGDPGVGKSAIAKIVAAEMDMPLHVLIGSTLQGPDVGGLPVKHVDAQGRATAVRVPLEMVRDAADRPCVLFLDELSNAAADVQASFLNLILDRQAGDVKLHPETRIIAACNPPEQAPGGFELTAPLMGRFCVLNFRPTETEVLDFMRGLGDDSDSASAQEKALAEESLVWAAIAGATPELLQIDIPRDCITGGQPWGSPRSWERALRSRAAAVALGIDPYGDVAYMLAAGSVGQKCATVYLGVMKMIKELPTVEEITADPKGCVCPSARDKQVAALGLMPRIAKKNLWAAYLYAKRLSPEFALAAHKTLMRMTNHQPPVTDPLTVEGMKARSSLSAMVAGPVKKI